MYYKFFDLRIVGNEKNVVKFENFNWKFGNFN